MKKIFRPTLLILILIVAVMATGCRSSKQKASGDLKKTVYCERYREFDDKVATAKPKEQKELLVAITKAKDFPADIAADYTTVINGYTKYLAGEQVLKDEKKYEEATKRIARHAIDHCELLKSDSGSGI